MLSRHHKPKTKTSMDSISPTHEALRCPQTPNNSPYNLLLPGDPRSPSIGRKFKNTLRRKLFRSSELKDEIESPSPLKLRSRKSIAGLFDALSPKSRPEKDTFERPKTTSPRKTKSDFSKYYNTSSWGIRKTNGRNQLIRLLHNKFRDGRASAIPLPPLGCPFARAWWVKTSLAPQRSLRCPQVKGTLLSQTDWSDL